MKTSKVVTVVQRRLTHYRIPLFEAMRSQLREIGIELRLVHGEGTSSEQSKGDSGYLPWALQLPTRYWLGGKICWQPFWSLASDSDLVVVTQENKQVNNLFALASPLRKTPIAFWGHGRNMQALQRNGIKERFKRWTTNRVDWWFAYTELSAKYVREEGFPENRITVLNNSIDTSALLADIGIARSTSRSALRAGLGLPESGPLAVFIGSLYAEKRIPWLLQAAGSISERVPGFCLAIAGDGPDRAELEARAAKQPHIHYLGSVRGPRKAELLAAADLMLNPGLVGLGILDAFVAGLPLLTTDCHLHSPEIAYLQPGTNGLVTPDDLVEYVEATVRLLENAHELAALSAGAAIAGTQYSIMQMAQRFCDGIQCALESTKG